MMATPMGRGTPARVQCGTPTGTAIKGRRQRQREEELKRPTGVRCDKENDWESM
jgi:hypothetical protein